MAQRDKPPYAALGFRVKTGRATAVILQGPADSPHALARRSIQLWDPKVPDSYQPYHAALEHPGDTGAKIARKACAAARAVARTAVRKLANEMRAMGLQLRGAAIVVGSETDPDKIHNAHIRAHALEGRLFPDIVREGAEAIGLSCLSIVEREAFAKAATALKRSPEELKRAVAELGRAVGKPWGVEEKTACLAAWMALAR